MTFKVFTDSASNLPSSQSDGIEIIPWPLIMDGQEMKSPKILEEFGYREFYDKIRHGARIKTSLLN